MFPIYIPVYRLYLEFNTILYNKGSINLTSICSIVLFPLPGIHLCVEMSQTCIYLPNICEHTFALTIKLPNENKIKINAIWGDISVQTFYSLPRVRVVIYIIGLNVDEVTGFFLTSDL